MTMLELSLRFAVILFAFGFFVDTVVKFSKRAYRKQPFFRKFDIFSLFMNFFILTGATMKAYDLFKEDCGKEAWNGTEVKDDCRCPNRTLNENQNYPQFCQLEACFNGIGMTMIILKTFYWYQLHPSLGPLAISVRKVLSDICMISIAYLVFFVAFTFGIGLMMHENGPDSKTNTTDSKIGEKNTSKCDEVRVVNERVERISHCLGGDL